MTGFLAPIVGLTVAAYLYSAAVIVMALASLLAVRLSHSDR
jgi:hypothetical protein